MDSDVRPIPFTNHSLATDVTQHYGQVDNFSLAKAVSKESLKRHGGAENVLKATGKNIFQHLPFYDKPEHKVINSLITEINGAIKTILAKPSWKQTEVDQKIASVLCLWNSQHGKIYNAAFLYTPSWLSESELSLAKLASVPWSSAVETEQMAILAPLEPAEDDNKKCFPAVSSIIDGIFRGKSAHVTTLMTNSNNSSDQDQEPLIDGEN